MITMNSIRKFALAVVGVFVISFGLSSMAEALTIVEKRFVKVRPNVIERNIVRGDLLTSKPVIVVPKTKVYVKKIIR